MGNGRVSRVRRLVAVLVMLTAVTVISSQAWAVGPAAPTLLSPISGSTNVVNPVTLAWNAVASATGYQVQVSTTSAFSTATTLAPVATGTKIQLPALTAKTLYYWRVSALMGPPAPPPTRATAPSTPPTPPTPPLPPPPPSTQVNWSAVRTFTTAAATLPPTPAPLAAPTLVSPANSASSVGNPVTLTWNAVTSATAYQVQVSTDSAFSTANTMAPVATGTKLQLPQLKEKTKQYWRVAAMAGNGCTPEKATTGATPPTPPAPPALVWSAVWSFTTGTNAPPPPPPPAPLAAPTLISPANSASSVGNPVTLVWNAVTSATSYQVQLSTTSAFSTATTLAPVATGTKQQLPPLKEKTLYYWRVAAMGGNGCTPEKATTCATPPAPPALVWSAVWTFTTGTSAPPAPKPPALPTLISPVNLATSVTRPVTLVWSAVSSATCYLVQVSTTNSFTASANTLQFYPTAAQQSLSQLAAGVTYYWRVKAVATSALMSDWSTVWSFTTVGTTPTAVLAAPILTSPASGATNLAQPVTLTWQAVTNATSYTVQIATDSAFSSNLSTYTGVTKTSYQLKSISVAVYYWRVKAVGTLNGVAAESTWSSTWHFTPAKPF